MRPGEDFDYPPTPMESDVFVEILQATKIALGRPPFLECLQLCLQVAHDCKMQCHSLPWCSTPRDLLVKGPTIHLTACKLHNWLCKGRLIPLQSTQPQVHHITVTLQYISAVDSAIFSTVRDCYLCKEGFKDTIGLREA